MDKNDLKGLLTGSRETDIATLLSAKEQAKRRLLEDPTDANLRAFERASRMLEEITQDPAEKPLVFSDRMEALRHLKGLGYKIGKSKFYTDARRGLLEFTDDGKITEKVLERYIKISGLQKFSEIGKKDGQDPAQLTAEKQSWDLRRLKAVTWEQEFKNAILEGQYHSREDCARERATVLALLDLTLRQNLRTDAERFIRSVSGDPRMASSLVEQFEALIDKTFRQLAKPKQYQVTTTETEAPAQEASN